MIFSSILKELDSNFKKYLDKLALMDANNKGISFSEFSDLVEMNLKIYHHLGLKNLDRVLVISKRPFHFYAMVMALFKIGACAILLDRGDRFKTVLNKIKICKPNYLITDFKLPFYLRFLLKVFFSLKCIDISKVTLSARQDFIIEKEPMDHSPALVNFTTGSTGNPKMNTRTYEKLYHQTLELRKIIHLHEFEKQLCFLPNVVLLNLLLAKSTYLNIDLENNNNVDVDSIAATPSHFLDLISRKEKLNKSFYESIKVIFCGGSPLYYHHAQLILEHFPNSVAYSIYGATEAEPMAYCTLKELMEAFIEHPKWGVLLGKSVDSLKYKIKLLDKSIYGFENFEGEIGELCVSGPHVFTSTSNNIWHQTGDLVLLNKGQLYFLGRIAHLLMHNNQYIPLVPIENELNNLIGKVATLIKNSKGKFVFIIEGEPIRDVNRLVQSLNLPFEYELKFIEKIPRDYRFSTKIDYAKLKMIFN